MSESGKVGTFGWVWIVGVFAFSIVRALVAWPTLGRFGVNPWVFLFIDVVTAFPYAYGQVKLIKECIARNLAAIQLWSLVVLATFLAPYIYIFVAGSGELPLIGYIIVTALIVVFGVASLLRLLRAIRTERAEQETPTQNTEQTMTKRLANEITVEVATTDEQIIEAKRFQAARYFEVGFIDEMPADGLIDDEWAETSAYHVARDGAGKVIGVCRFVRPSAKGLPLFRFFDFDPAWMATIQENIEDTYEMGALAVDPDANEVWVAAALYRETVRQFRVYPGQVHLLAALDSQLLEAMVHVMHFPFQKIGAPAMLTGGESTPVYLYIPDGLMLQIEKAPDAARFFSGFETLDLLEDEVIDLRSAYPEFRPAAGVIDLTTSAQEKLETLPEQP